MLCITRLLMRVVRFFRNQLRIMLWDFWLVVLFFNQSTPSQWYAERTLRATQLVEKRAYSSADCLHFSAVNF